jgi:hypothetical protein
MAEARRLLLHTDLTVAAVGSQVGYASTGTFTTQFTRLVGEPPARFRQLARRLAGRRWAPGGWAEARPASAGAADGLVVRIAGEVPAGCLIVGLEPAQETRSAWSVSPTGGTPVLPATPGEYRLRVVVVETGVPLTDALIDEVPGSRLARDATVRLGPGRHAPVTVTVRPPSELDPPILAAAPLRRLVSSPLTDCPQVLRVS